MIDKSVGRTVRSTVVAEFSMYGKSLEMLKEVIREIAPVASIGGAPYVMVINASVPAKTVSEFIAYAKANPGKINMGSSGSPKGVGS
jgi:tripartite-type tricarboxylate transporter receptor subunit TctC